MRGLSCSLIAFFLLVSPAVGKLDLADFGGKLADTFKGGVPELAKLDLSELFSDKLETKEDILKDRKDILKKSKDACEIPVYNPKEFAKCPPPTPPCTAENTLTVEALLTRLGLPPQNAFRSCDPARLKDAFKGVCRFEGTIVISIAADARRGFDSVAGCASLNDADLVEAFSSLREITGTILASSRAVLNVKTLEGFSGLVTAGDIVGLTLQSLETIVPPAFCNLRSANFFFISSEASRLRTIVLPNLEWVGDSGVAWNSAVFLDLVWLPKLQVILGGIRFDGPARFRKFYAPLLERIGGLATNPNVEGLECLNLPSLRSAGRLLFTHPSGKQILLPKLESVDGPSPSFRFTDMPILELVQIPSTFAFSQPTQNVNLQFINLLSLKNPTETINTILQTAQFYNFLRIQNVEGLKSVDLSAVVAFDDDPNNCRIPTTISGNAHLTEIIFSQALVTNYIGQLGIFNNGMLGSLDSLGQGLVLNAFCSDQAQLQTCGLSSLSSADNTQSGLPTVLETVFENSTRVNSDAPPCNVGKASCDPTVTAECMAS